MKRLIGALALLGLTMGFAGAVQAQVLDEMGEPKMLYPENVVPDNLGEARMLYEEPGVDVKFDKITGCWSGNSKATSFLFTATKANVFIFIKMMVPTIPSRTAREVTLTKVGGGDVRLLAYDQTHLVGQVPSTGAYSVEYGPNSELGIMAAVEICHRVSMKL